MSDYSQVMAVNQEKADRPKQTLGFLFGYGIGDFGLNIYWNSLSLILVFWYADVAGLSPHTASFVFSIGLAWDAISDPIVASFAERHRSRFGSYRPFILFGSFALGLSFLLLFWIPPLNGFVLIVYFVFANVLFRTCYTLVAVPYSALSSRLTYDSRTRAELSGTRMIFAFLGMLAITSLWFPLSRYFGGGEESSPTGFFIAAGCGAIAATAALCICFLMTRERPPLGKHPAKRENYGRAYLQALKSNDALRILLVVIFLNSAAGASFLIPLAFYLEANQTIFAQKEVVMTAYALATLFALPLWTFIIRNIGKKRVWYIACMWSSLSMLHLFFFGPILVSEVPLQVVLIGIGSGAFAILVWAIIPDTVEYGQHKSGSRAEGPVFGTVLLIQKTSGSVTALMVGTMLTYVGYDSTMELQTLEVAENLGKFLSLTPAVLLILSAFVIMKLPVNKKVHARIVDELSA